jgi:hypothetical protein
VRLHLKTCADVPTSHTASAVDVHVGGPWIIGPSGLRNTKTGLVKYGDRASKCALSTEILRGASFLVH